MPDSRHKLMGLLALLVVSGSIVLSAVMLVHAKHESRQLFVRLERLNAARDRLQIDWGRLKIEQSTWATHGRVERLARERLEMTNPAPAEVLLVSER